MSVKSLTMNEPFIGRIIRFPERAETKGPTQQFLDEGAKVLDLEVARIAHIVPAPHRVPAHAQAEAHRLRAVYFRWFFRLIGTGLGKLFGRR